MDKVAYLSAMGIDTWLPRTLPTTSPTDLIDINALAQQVAQCSLCPLHIARQKAVFGTGNLQAEVMFVGEGPGAQEDKQGLPFVGRAGQLLNAMLQAINLSREQVYITNVVKCRPPNNRDPLLEEVRTCTPYLEQQIAFIRPKIIVALGRVASHYLLQTAEPLSKLRRDWHQFAGGIPLMVTYHPAYLLRNPADKANAWLDLRRLQQQLHARA